MPELYKKFYQQQKMPTRKKERKQQLQIYEQNYNNANDHRSS